MLKLFKGKWLWAHWSVCDYGFKPGRDCGFVLFPRERQIGPDPYGGVLNVECRLAFPPRLSLRAFF